MRARTSSCPRCKARAAKQDTDGVWFCSICGHEYEPYVLAAAERPKPYSGTDCPVTGRPHRLRGERCVDCQTNPSLSG